MKFHSLALEGFKSFRTRQEFVFPSSSGLFFVTGTNLVEPELGANGIGKSTLFDALFFVLYDKTPRGVRGPNVISWGSKSCFVQLKLSLRGKLYTITRKKGPNDLLVQEGEEQPRTVTQDELEKIIGLSSLAFENSILIPQVIPLFLDLSAPVKMDLFSDILSLDQWMSRSEAAKVKADRIAADLKYHEQGKASLEGSLAQLEKQLQELVSQAEHWEADRQFKIQSKRLDASEISNVCQRMMRFIDTETERHKELINASAVIADSIKYLEEVDKISREEIQTRRVDLAGFQQERTAYIKERQKFSIDLAVCPYCHQPVSPEHIRNEVAELSEALNECNAMIKAQEELISNVVLHDQDISFKRKQLDDMTLSAQTLATMIYGKKTELAVKQNELRTLLVEIDGLEQEQNTILDQLEKKIADRDALKAHLLELQGVIESTRKDFEAASYWIKGFKQVRLYLIDTALQQLELETNSCLEQLGLPGWKIKYDVEKETTNKTISKGFVTFVQSPYNIGWVPWEAWSGGENQRLRLAGTFGLSNLILRSAGLNDCNVQILDEPSSHLSRQGIESMLETLSYRSRTLGKQIFLVEHHSIDYNFDGVVSISKTEAGSMIDA